MYSNIPPPTLIYKYDCKNCAFWDNGKCKAVEGEISKDAWCIIWIPNNPLQPAMPKSIIDSIKKRLME